MVCLVFIAGIISITMVVKGSYSLNYLPIEANIKILPSSYSYPLSNEVSFSIYINLFKRGNLSNIYFFIKMGKYKADNNIKGMI